MSLSKSSSSGLKMQVNFNPAFPLENSVDFTYLLLNLTTPGTHHVRWAYYLGDNPSPYDYARIGVLFYPIIIIIKIANLFSLIIK